MHLLIGLIFLLAFTYPVFIYWVYRQWSRFPSQSGLLSIADLPTISVVVPARNESLHIGACLESLTNQSYPEEKYEILVVDDFSTDNTSKIVSSWKSKGVKLIKLSDFLEEGQINAFKKRAIETAIKQANGQFIVTTDADCIAPPNWLSLLGNHLKFQGFKALAAPANFFRENSLLERFQSLDYIGMMGLTAAGIRSGAFYLCNGANFAYERDAFWEVGGFDGIDQVASGDDLLLLYKFSRKYPSQIGFLKKREATVLTYPKTTFKSFFSQRIRWASKSDVYQDKGLKLIQSFVFIYCLLIVCFLISGVFIPGFLSFFVIYFLLKFGADVFYLTRLCGFFGRNDLKKSLFGAQILHIIYILIVGVSSIFILEHQWKGRKIR